MKKGGFVTLDDLIDAWVGVRALDRRGQRFVIVADSCFSGALVDQLKAEHASCIVHHASYVMRHTSCIIHHMSCIVHHTSLYVIHHIRGLPRG